MSLYDDYVLPHLIGCACGMRSIESQRAKVVPLAQGKVLEIGMGSGLNLKHYNAAQVKMIWGLEPSVGMRRKAQANIVQNQIPFEWLDLPSESIALPNDSVDTVVLTYTLCTIQDWSAALGEMKRVLKPAGQMVFSEHGEAPDANIRKWQQRVNPLWKRLVGGCNLNRKIPHLIESAGFTISELNQRYIKGPKIATYQYYGVAH